MAKLKIITGEDNPILRAVSAPVKNFDKNLKRFAKDLEAAMDAANGLGIAAPQVGENIRVFIAILDFKEPDEKRVVMVNPVILEHSEATTLDEEGCLSLPGRYGKVKRWKSLKVEFYDLEGRKHVRDLSDLNARVVQHEGDHLDGVLFIDKLAQGEKEEDLLM